MKVVLFCGGMGLRIRDAGQRLPKPLVPIGGEPVLWEIMRYYAHHGHTDFILCLGHQGDVIREYFLEEGSRLCDRVFPSGETSLYLAHRNARDWRVTFADTGVDLNVGQRLRAVQEHLVGEEMFLANYGDIVTDAPLDEMVAWFAARDATCTFLCVPPRYSFHVVTLGEDDQVAAVTDIAQSDVRINGGYFALRSRIFDYIGEGEDLVDEPFERLVEDEQLLAYSYDGFWAPMDTFKDKERLDALLASGAAPWQVWTDPVAESADSVTA